MTTKPATTVTKEIDSLLRVVSTIMKTERDTTDAALEKMTDQLDGAQTELRVTLQQALKSERSVVDARINGMQKQLDAIDGSVLLKSTSVALMEAGLAALVGYCDSVTLKKSVRIRGDLPALVKGLIG